MIYDFPTKINCDIEYKIFVQLFCSTLYSTNYDMPRVLFIFLTLVILQGILNKHMINYN